MYTLLLLLILVFSISIVHSEDNITDTVCLSDDAVAYEADDSNNLHLSGDTFLSENSKNKTELVSPSAGTYYRGDYHITLKDSNSTQGIANKTINFRIDNANYTGVTDNDGVARVSLALNPGKYSVTAYFMGDESYETSNYSSTFDVLPTIKSQDFTKYYKGSVQYTATFFTSDGGFLANRDVVITVNGQPYTRKTNAYGVVSLPVNLKPGTYSVVSTDPITGYKQTNTFRILDTISAGNLQKFIGDGKKFNAKFLKNNGQSLAKKVIKFKLKGKTYKVKTNSQGWASLSLKKLKKGTYNIVCYNTDGLSKTYKIQVYKNKATTRLTTSSYTFHQNDAKSIKAKFTTSIGGASVSGKVIKIKINGKTYSRTTDSNGMVYFNLPSLGNGLYKVEYKYTGTKYIKASSSTNYITLINTRTPEFNVKSTTSFGYGAGTEFKVAVTAGGVPLIKKTVTFTINGKNYVKTTNEKGIASIPIDLAIGKYRVNYMIPDDKDVNGSSDYCDINVFKRSDSRLTWQCGSNYKDNSQTFKVLLTDKKGNPVSGERVSLTVDGETYTDTTSSAGYALFKTDIAIGKYKVSFEFGGNNELLKSSESHSINVELSMFKNGINEKHASGSGVLLKSSSHCKVGAKKIKKVVKKLTKGLTNKVDKAKAIFNYVRDTLSYSYYYNSKYGSTKTLKLKRGNCVDHSHLLVAMYRTAGFKAKYVHGRCTFSDERTGHVWAQVLIDGKWVCADAVSYKNSLGKIRNWNTKTFTLQGKYSSLPF